MRHRNKFPGYCAECGDPVDAGEGFLAGKDESDGRWRIECRDCSELTPWQRYRQQEADRVRREQEARREAEARREREAAETQARYEQIDAILNEAARLMAERKAWLESQRVPACFKVLGIIPPVDVPTIKTRYRNLSLVLHPDHGGDARRFIEIQSAYEQALQLVGGAA